MSAGATGDLPTSVSAPIERARPNNKSERVSVRERGIVTLLFRDKFHSSKNDSKACIIAPEFHGEPLKVYFQGPQHDSDESSLLATPDWCADSHLGNHDAGGPDTRNKNSDFLVGSGCDNRRPLDSLACDPQTSGIGF
jgi:hypothetical protein